MRLRHLTAGLCIPLGVAGPLVAISPAEAALTTACRGTAGAVTVPGDLVVPAGASCELTGTSVDGNVTVRRGATLLMDGVDVAGNLVVQADAYAEATSSTVEGTTRLAQSFGLVVEDSTLEGAVTSNIGGFFYATTSTVEGNVRSTSAETVLESSVVEGSVNADGDTLTDFYDSQVDGNVTVGAVVSGSAFCSSEVDGRLAVRASEGLVSLGSASDPDCGSTYVGDGLVLRDNLGGVELFGTIVRGATQCVGNDPAPIGARNRFRGGATGQCAALPATQPAARTTRPQARVQVAPSVAARTASIQKRAAKRSAAGAAAAAAAGDAQIGR